MKHFSWDVPHFWTCNVFPIPEMLGKGESAKVIILCFCCCCCNAIYRRTHYETSSLCFKLPHISIPVFLDSIVFQRQSGQRFGLARGPGFESRSDYYLVAPSSNPWPHLVECFYFKSNPKILRFWKIIFEQTPLLVFGLILLWFRCFASFFSSLTVF